MKRIISLTLFISLTLTISAQHDYDSQGIIYSFPSGTGIVGIGMTPSNPNYALDVNGTINASDILKNGTSIATPWTINGNDILYTTGNIGIGIPPASNYKLDVDGTINATNILINGNSISSPWTTIGSGIAFGTGNVGVKTNPSAYYSLDVSGPINADEIHIGGVQLLPTPWVTNGSNIRYMAGNVGIGANPSSFHSNNNQLVVGDGSGSNGITIFSQSNSSSRIAFTNINSTVQEGMIEYNHSSDNLRFKVNNSDKLYINNLGDLQLLSGSSLIELGQNQSGPHGLLFGDNDAGNEGLQLLYRTSPNQLVIENKNDGTSGDVLFSIDYDNEYSYFRGNVGIGNTNPLHALDVNGWARIDDLTLANDYIKFEGHDGFHRISFEELRLHESGNSDVLTVKNGLVGVGTITPTDKLDVEGDIRLNNNALQLHPSDDNHSLQRIAYLSGDHVDGPYLKGWSGGALGTSAGGDKSVITWRSNGNVGINVPIPSAALEVKGMVKFDGDNTEDELVSKSNVGFRSLEFHQLRFHEWSHGNVLNISGGKVGIWTTTPAKELDVVGTIQSTVAPTTDAFVVTNNNTNNIDFKVKGNGTVYAREVEVNLTTFPDYVFEDSYELMKLEDLRSFIAKENHLPGIKSAKEVEEEGIGLGELSRIQMEKIEELTLYILQLEERIRSLENK